MKKKSPFLFFLFNFSFLIFNCVFSQQPSSLDATYIADTYPNSIVKILLYDSIAEKDQPGSGYIGRGSGFLVTEDGIVFTNRHVIEYCVYGYMDYIQNVPPSYEQVRMVSAYSESIVNDELTKKVIRAGHTVPIVQIYSGKEEDAYKLYYAKVVALDAGAYDGAILKIISDINRNPVTEKFHTVPIGNSDSTKQGEDLCVYGFPAQFDAGLELTLKDLSTLTFGKHSGFDFVFNKDYGYIKTDAAINSGNSGGPVFGSNNKVVGIATATSNKTNIGLVGGINGMYTIAKSDTNLLSALKNKGLKPPPQKAEAGSVIMTGEKKKIMEQRKLIRIASNKATERKFQGGTFYLKLFFIPSPKDEFTLDTIGGLPLLNPNEPMMLASNPSGGWETGYLFPLWRITPYVKLSLDYTFLGARATIISWDKVNLNPDITDSGSVFYQKDMFTANFYTKLGPSVSFLLFKKFMLGFHYQAVPTFLFFDDASVINYKKNPDYYSLSLNNSLAFNHEIGIWFRFRVLSVGVQNVFGSPASLKYTMMKNGISGNSPQGKLKTKALLFTLSFNMGGGEEE